MVTVPLNMPVIGGAYQQFVSDEDYGKALEGNEVLQAMQPAPKKTNVGQLHPPSPSPAPAEPADPVSLILEKARRGEL